jgi:pectate lyase
MYYFNKRFLSVAVLVAWLSIPQNMQAQTCQESSLYGWATQGGGTTGGEGGKKVTVTTLADLNTQAQKTEKLIIYVKGNLTGAVSIKSNKTVYGLPGASIKGKISISGSSNIIVRNLIIRGNTCGSYDDCRAGDDGITVGGSHHVWLDHLDIADGQDGNCDITSGSDFVTVSWCKFWYTYNKEHRFSNLNSSADDALGDRGKLSITFHHNWWADRVVERQPRVRFGKVHVANNLYTSTTSNYIVGVGFEADMLVEGNIMKTAAKPYQFFLMAGNFTGLKTRNNQGPDSVNFYSGSAFVPPYALTIDNPTANLEQTLRQCAGATLPDPITTGIEENELNQKAEVYPNPFSDQLQVEALVGASCVLRDAQGNMVLEATDILQPIQTSHLPVGLYFITLNGLGIRQTYKLLKVKK